MNQKILQYALFSHFYKSSVLDCFVPFVVSTMEQGVTYSAEQLQTCVKEKHGFQIPLHVIGALVHQGLGRNIVGTTAKVRNPFPVFITESGLETKDAMAQAGEISREITLLEREMLVFFRSRHFPIPPESLVSRIERILERNIVNFADFFIGGNSGAQLDGIDATDGHVIEFILFVEKNSPSLYQLITNIFFGSIYKSFLTLSPEETDGVLHSDFSNIKLYFDANFLFSLIMLHDEEYSKPIAELFEILKDNKFQFRVFDITIDEMVQVLKGYLAAQNSYPQNIRVNSLYSFLKRNHYDRTKVYELIVDLPDKLERLGILRKATGIDLITYRPEDEELSSRLRRFKPFQPEFYHSHDVAILEKSLKFNKSRIYKFEDASELVVTSDFILAKLSRVHSSHDKSSSVSEVVLDRVLTGLLFLKNPKSQVSLNTIISIFRREMFIKRSVWEQFFKTVQKLQAEGKITDNSIVNLFYSNMIESDLRYMTDQDAESLTEDKVLEMFELAATQADLQRKAASSEQQDSKKRLEAEYSEKLFSVVSDKEKEMNKERERIVGILQKEADSEAKTVRAVVRAFLGLLLLVPLIPAAVDIFKGIYQYESLWNIVRYAFFGLDLLAFSVKPLWEKLFNWVYKRRLQRKLTKFAMLDSTLAPS